MSESNEETTTRRTSRRSEETRETRKSYGKNNGAMDFEGALERGYIGTVPDETPNENYTVAGVTSGAPTPETDKDAYDAQRSKTARRFDGQ